MSAFAEAHREEARRKKRSPRAETIRVYALAGILSIFVFFGLLIGSALVAYAIFLIPRNTFNWVPSFFVAFFGFPDWHTAAGQGIIDSTIGSGIAFVLYRRLGQKKQNKIAEDESKMKYYHLKLTDHEKKPFIINWNSKQGYPLPFYLEGIAKEGIIRDAKDSEIKAVSDWNEQEPTPKELDLSP